MPFVKVDPIAEAMELQEMFSDDPATKELFRHYEMAHRENARLEKEEMELRQRLVPQRASGDTCSQCQGWPDGHRQRRRECVLDTATGPPPRGR